MQRTCMRLVLTAGQQRPEHANRVIIALQQLPKALAELACVPLLRIACPGQTAGFFQDVLELKAHSEIDVWLGRVDKLLAARAASRRTWLHISAGQHGARNIARSRTR